MSTKRKQIKPQKLLEQDPKNENTTQNNLTASDKVNSMSSSSDQENFLKFLNQNSSPMYQQMTNLDDFYKLYNFLKFFCLNNDYTSLLLQQQFQNCVQSSPAAPVTQQTTQTVKKPNTTDLLKQSIDKIFSSSENLTDKSSLKRKKSYEQDTQPESSDIFAEHLKQSNHHRKNSTDAPVLLSSNINNSHKMVRGQEEWVNNSRNNNFISQVLKCLECSASFETLSDLSSHMLKSNHFSKFHSQSILNPTHTQTPTTTANLIKNKQSTNVKSAFQSLNNTRSSVLNSEPNKNILNQTLNYSCKICAKNFSNDILSSLPPLIGLIQHLKNVHSLTHICTNCGDYFENIKELSDHLVEFHHHHNNSHNHSQTVAKNNLTTSSNDFNKKTKLDLLSPSGQQKKQLKNLNSSISPSSVSCSSTSSSSNSNTSSPSSFLYENKDNNNNNNKNSTSHPLLALQMFVNGSSQPQSKQSTTNQPQLSKPQISQQVSPSSKDNTISKLPAKKRPYVSDGNTEENEPKKIKKSETNNAPTSPVSTSSSHNQPLHLLQNMRLNLDDYFSR